MDIKSQIIELLKSTDRPGIDTLIEHMEEIGYFTSPCSGGFHLCKEGGLAEHSLNVYNFMNEIWTGNKYRQNITQNEVIISALLHDLGKASYRNKPNYVPNILKSGKVSESKPFETNTDRLYIAHEIVSLQIASKYIELTEEEEFAILYHNGLYVASGRDINGKERPLQQLLHFSDMWCSRFVEKEG
jgi:23S rRNA maturation-related 3'-5' exoribonuclease YhaM